MRTIGMLGLRSDSSSSVAATTGRWRRTRGAARPGARPPPSSPPPSRSPPRRAGRPAPPTPIGSQADRTMTTTPSPVDADLMELVRSADPFVGDVNPVTDEAVESMLREIMAAPRPDRPPGRSRTVVLRLAAVGGAAAVALGAITAITGDDRGGVAPASAAVVRHALAAATQPPGTILHVDMRGTQ